MSRYLLFFTFIKIVSAVFPDHARFSTSHADHFVSRNVTPLCLSDTTHWMSQLSQGELWALKMLDSWTKLPSGVLFGSDNHLGNFEQCIKVSVQDTVATFSGQYFRALSQVEIPGHVFISNATNAFCVPLSCSIEDITDLMQDHIGPALGITISIWSINIKDLQIKESAKTIPTDALIFIIITGVFVGVVVLSGIIEWRLRNKTPVLVRACSLTSTCRSLFNTRKHPSDISCLHGLRVGSMLWIVLGHRFMNNRYQPISNPDIFVEYYSHPLIMTVVSGAVAVDTFFFLSGILMCISFLRDLRRSKQFDVVKFYLYRYLRLATPIAAVILLYITILPLIGSGPIWNNYFQNESRNCKANWWTNMVFVNNVIKEQGFGQCIGQTWYTAVDMQLAWLSPLVLLPLYHSPRAGLQLMTLLILISCFIPFTLTYIYHFPMSIIQVPIDIPMEGVPKGNFDSMIYRATQSRATPYLCGIIFGYYLYRKKNNKTELTKPLLYLGWTCSTVVALTIIYSLSIPHQLGYVYDALGSAFYAGFHRLGWSAVIIWIVFACINRSGGFIDKILSWNLFLPFSRLTYGTFLVHYISIMYESATRQTLERYSDYDSLHHGFGDLIPVYIMSFLLYVLIEGPLMSFLRIAFSKGKQPPKKLEKKTEE